MHPGRLSTKCNTFIKENFSRSFPVETFSGAVVEYVLNKSDFLFGDRPEIKSFRKEKSNDIVGVFVRTALPWAMRLCKVDKGI